MQRTGFLGASVVIFAGCLAVSSPTLAQSRESRFSLEVGAFLPQIETTAQFSANGLVGTVIDFETATGLEDSPTLPSVRATARGGRWLAEAEYFSLRRSGSSVLTADIDFDGVVFPASVQVDSQFDTDIWRFSLGYLFVDRPDLAVGGTVGLHATSFDVGITGEGRVGGIGPVLTQTRRREFLAPLPTAGLFAAWDVTPRVILGTRLDLISLTSGDFSGGVTNAEATIAYQLTDRVDVGASYRYVTYDLDVDRADYDAVLDYTFSGPSVFLRYNF